MIPERLNGPAVADRTPHRGFASSEQSPPLDAAGLLLVRAVSCARPVLDKNLLTSTAVGDDKYVQKLGWLV